MVIHHTAFFNGYRDAYGKPSQRVVSGRRISNGLDRCALLAEYAATIERILRSAIRR
jgi:hypothetical protein